MKVICPYCGEPATLVNGNKVYPHRIDLFEKNFWFCEKDQAWVGCHKPAAEGGLGDGTAPLGRLADAALRRAKSAAHVAFDPLWKTKIMTRRAAYQWMQREMGLDSVQGHIGMMDEEQCYKLVELVRHRAPDDWLQKLAACKHTEPSRGPMVTVQVPTSLWQQIRILAVTLDKPPRPGCCIDVLATHQRADWASWRHHGRWSHQGH